MLVEFCHEYIVHIFDSQGSQPPPPPHHQKCVPQGGGLSNSIGGLTNWGIYGFDSACVHWCSAIHKMTNDLSMLHNDDEDPSFVSSSDHDLSEHNLLDH